MQLMDVLSQYFEVLIFYLKKATDSADDVFGR